MSKCGRRAQALVPTLRASWLPFPTGSPRLETGERQGSCRMKLATRRSIRCRVECDVADRRPVAGVARPPRGEGLARETRAILERTEDRLAHRVVVADARSAEGRGDA